MVEETSLFSEQLASNSLQSASLGYPQAIYDLAQAYMSIPNFREAINWLRALSENDAHIAEAISLLQQIPAHTQDPLILEEVHQTIAELQNRAVSVTAKQSEVGSFLLHATE